ncbi:MAG: rhomboid family intramembrane serine protease [Caldilineae bacterium]|nr:MAG: rhomboid family intramembrane serine protease [Caldilineae bacterium]
MVTALFGLVDYEAFVGYFGLVPFQLTQHLDAHELLTLFTSMFLHGSVPHLAGNMLYLWIFGDNVEDAMGHLGYLIFYILGGLVASMAHVLSNPFSTLPTVGASGAIAAVLGAYMMLYPTSRVHTLIPLGYYLRVTLLPAAVVLGVWFLFELIQGFVSLGAAGAADMGGVAFWAHIGGFVAGFGLARVFARPRDVYGGPNY